LLLGIQKPMLAQPLALDKQFAEISQQRTIHLEVSNALEQQIPPDQLMAPSLADAILQLRLYDIRFARTLSGSYTLTLKSVMVVSWNRHKSSPGLGYRHYEYTSRSLPLDDWVQNEGEILNQELDTCVEGLAEQMVRDIRFREP
jgi:hypothetical protein